ncbi:DUF5134 domain-containing protein [Streptomyces sp. NPDC101118]|uniref:DUF5134 domain-containing protein n=1 Tax=Streptomyces sp. NPDC101118 TaxID=3366109 RepID=UPI00380ABA9F
MHGTTTTAWLLVLLCAASGGYCLVRLRTGAAEERAGAGAEALMAFGMAAMAVPAAALWSPEWSRLLLGGVFLGAGTWALWGLRRPDCRRSHHVHHAVGSLAMVYVVAAMAAVPAAGGAAHHAVPGAGGVPLLTGVLLLYYAGYVLRGGVRLLPVAARGGAGLGAGGGAGAGASGGAGADRGAPGAGRVPGGARGEVAEACRLAMGMGMFAMLVGL